MGVATKSSKARDLPGQQSRLKNAEFHRIRRGTKHASKMPLHIPRMLHMKLEPPLQTLGGEKKHEARSPAVVGLDLSSGGLIQLCFEHRGL